MGQVLPFLANLEIFGAQKRSIPRWLSFRGLDSTILPCFFGPIFKQMAFHREGCREVGVGKLVVGK